MTKLLSKIMLWLMLITAFAVPAQAAFTPNKLYNNQATGSNPNTWGIVLGSNFTSIDSNLGGTLPLNVGGASNVTLTSSQAQNLIYDFTGTLTGNIIVYFPAQGGFYYVNNETSGAFTLTVEGVGASSGVVVPQGQMFPVVIDNSTSPPTALSLTLGFATAGANSNITSLSGLTTPLSAAQGGSATYAGGTTGGSANAQTLSSTVPSNFTLAAGNMVTGIAGATNTGAATLAVDGTTATAIRKETPSGLAALTGNEMVIGQPYVWYYDGTYFDLIGAGNNPFTTEGTIASASTTDLGSVATSNVIGITGSSTINSFGSSANTNNPIYFIRFTGAPTLTYNSGSMILPGAANIVAAAGDSAEAQYLGSGNWRIVRYTTANPGVTAGSYTNANITVNALGQVTAAASATQVSNRQTFLSSGTWSKPAGYDSSSPVLVEVWSAGGGGSSGGAGTGGSSSFGSYLTVYGGIGGGGNGQNGGNSGGIASSTNTSSEGQGGSGKGGDGIFYGGGGGGPSNNIGGNSVYGGGGGADSTPGTSIFGGNGGNGGAPGSQPGGGGGAAAGTWGGGGGGSYMYWWTVLSNLSSSVSVTVGLGGAGASGGSAGGNGEVRVTVF